MSRRSFPRYYKWSGCRSGRAERMWLGAQSNGRAHVVSELRGRTERKTNVHERFVCGRQSALPVVNSRTKHALGRRAYSARCSNPTGCVAKIAQYSGPRCAEYGVAAGDTRHGPATIAFCRVGPSRTSDPNAIPEGNNQQGAKVSNLRCELNGPQSRSQAQHMSFATEWSDGALIWSGGRVLV